MTSREIALTHENLLEQRLDDVRVNRLLVVRIGEVLVSLVLHELITIELTGKLLLLLAVLLALLRSVGLLLISIGRWLLLQRCLVHALRLAQIKGSLEGLLGSRVSITTTCQSVQAGDLSRLQLVKLRR